MRLVRSRFKLQTIEPARTSSNVEPFLELLLFHDASLLAQNANGNYYWC